MFKKKIYPKVSIIVISHRYKFLAQAIESIERQDYPNIEVLVHHTLADPHIQMIENGKVNRLIEASVGEFTSILCEDDEYDPRFVSRTVDMMIKKDVDLIYTDRLLIGATNGLLRSGEFTKEAFNKSIVSPLPGTFLVKKKWLQLVGGYTSEWFADHHLPRELCRHGAKAYHIEEPLFFYRLHMTNRSNSDNLLDFTIKYYKKYPHYAQHLDPNNATNEEQREIVVKVLNSIYGSEDKWPQRHVQLL